MTETDQTVAMTLADVADLTRLRNDEAIRRAETLGNLTISGEEVHPDSPWVTTERIQQLRLALGGLGRVGTHLDREGCIVGQQIQIILTPHEVEAFLMRLTGQIRWSTETVGPTA